MDRGSKIINIIIIVCLLVTIGVCLYFVLNVKDPVERDIFLVEQKDSLGTKIVSDNSYYQNIEKTDKQTIIYSAREDDSMLNPDDAIVPGGSGTNKQSKDTEGSGLITYVDYSIAELVEVKPITDEVNPIKFHEDGEVIEILKVEEVEERAEEEESPISKATLLSLLISDADKRNEGRVYISSMTFFQTKSGNSVYLNDCKSMPVILVPFTLEDMDTDFLKSLVSYMYAYSGRVKFMLVGYSSDGINRLSAIYEKLKDAGVSEDVPVYFDNAYNLLSVLDGQDYKFLVLNYDSYVMLSVSKGEYNSNSLNIEEIIRQYNEEKEIAVNEANRIEIEYIDSVYSGESGSTGEVEEIEDEEMEDEEVEGEEEEEVN